MNQVGKLLFLFFCLGVASGAEEGDRLLTRVAEVRELTREAAEQGLPVRLECVVLLVTPSGAFVHDGDSSIWAEKATAAAKPLWQVPPPEDFGPGSVILLDGKTVPGGYAPSVRPTAMRFLRRGELPEPRRPPMESVVSGSEECQWIELEGVVQDAVPSTYSREIRFDYKSGTHGLDITAVELLADGQPVTEDRHTGFSGSHPKDAVYQLSIPPSAKKPLDLRFTAAGAGGNDSHGRISISPKR